MTPEKINRINELSAKQRTEIGLTEEEKAEQAVLRQEYRASIRRNLEVQLSGNVITEDK